MMVIADMLSLRCRGYQVELSGRHSLTLGLSSDTDKGLGMSGMEEVG